MLRFFVRGRTLPVIAGLFFVSVAAISLAAAAEDEAAKEGDEKSLAATNPYAPFDDFSLEELAGHIKWLNDKPKTIQKRDAYVEAMVVTCERILKGEPDSKQKQAAALNLFHTLHRTAVMGAVENDKKLMDWAEKLKAGKDEKIVDEAKFHLLEKRVLDLREKELADEEAEKALKELEAYFKGRKLSHKHLRLASETMGLINGLDPKKREKHFQAFGGVFAKSEDEDLARYGRRIAKQPSSSGGPGGDLIGKPLEITGVTVDGEEFDLKSYRGKVVLVDFWATWCGPCVREMPNVKSAYEKYHDKGFEVVGISLDRTRDPLETFIADHAIPWVNLYDEDAGGRHPMAEKYNIRAIPAVFLVGKDGKVITTSARGPALEVQLEKLLGEGAKEEK